jgi:hypothetical protein
MSEKHESEHHPDPTVARGIKHSLNWAGECVHWCRACEANTRAGRPATYHRHSTASPRRVCCGLARCRRTPIR